MWNDSICHPDVIQELHDIFIEGKDKGNIKTHSAKARHCSLVKSAKEIGFKIPKITEVANLNYWKISTKIILHSLNISSTDTEQRGSAMFPKKYLLKEFMQTTSKLRKQILVKVPFVCSSFSIAWLERNRATWQPVNYFIKRANYDLPRVNKIWEF